VYTYPIVLVNSSILQDTTLKVEPIDHAYIPNWPSQLALFTRYNFKVGPTDCVYLPNSPSQLALFAQDNS
jgi:hypothetical protein